MSELPAGWAAATLDDLGDYLNGMAFKPEDWTGAGFPIIRIQNLTNPDRPLNRTERAFDDRYRVSSGDLLISWSATLDAFIWDREDAVLNQHIFKVTPSAAVDHKFLYYASRQAIRDLISTEHLHGSTMKHINRGPFLAHQVGLPPIAEQRRIVAKLDALTARTARARADLDRIPALAARYKQAVLASCFTPRNSSELVELGSIVSFENGDRGANYPSENEQLDEGHCLFLGTRNVLHGAFDWRGAKFISRSKHERLSGGTLRHGDIVLTIRGTLGNCAVYDESAPYEVVRINSAMIIVRPRSNVMSRYVMWALRSPAFLGWVGSSARGSAQPHLRAADIKSTKVRLPDLDEQAAIVMRVERAFAEIDRLTAEAVAARRLIDRLDQAVLAKAFRGELVPQDPADEPASVLLERIRAERAAAPKAKRGRKPVPA